jgi:hypothetical protein
MDLCLLCDPHSVARGNDSAPICAPHRQQAQTVFAGAEPRLRAHLEQAYGGELDEWIRQGVLPGLTWHLQVRDHPPAHGPKEPPRPGRPMHFERDPDGVVRILRELVVSALEQQVPLADSAAVLRVGTLDGQRTARLDPATTRTELQCLVTSLVTVDKLQDALRGLPLASAERAVIDAAVEGERDSDELVSALGVLSPGAEWLAFVRTMSVGETMLIDPVEVADQAYVGSGEFVYGWWEIRAALAEPARQWVELLEGRFPRARWG